MTDRTCTINGCDRPLNAKGLCGLHRRRQLDGKPIHAPIRVVLKKTPGQLCSVGGCGDEACSVGLCNKHYLRHRIHGDTGRERYRQPEECKIEGCAKKVCGLELCSMHYSRLKRHGDPHWTPARRLCEWGDCDTPAYGVGLCPLHYTRQRRGNDMDAPRKHRNLGKKCTKPECDRPAKCRGLCRRHYLPVYRTETGNIYVADGYEQKWVNGRPVSVHRIVMEEVLGRPLRQFENVHHLNGRRADNRPSNLELWTVPQPSGQRPEDLVAWVIDSYPDMVRSALSEID